MEFLKKEMIILVLLVLVISGCASSTEIKDQESKDNNDNKEMEKYAKSLNLDEFQEAACDAASENNRCDELPDLGLVKAEECCKELNKCC